MKNVLLTALNKALKQIQGPVDNPHGSVILITLLLLLLMTVIGISATNTAITESYILRNAAIRQQNISLVEAAALEITQGALVNIPDPVNAYLAQTADSSTREPYIIPQADWDAANGDDAWYAFGTLGSGRILSGSSRTVTDAFNVTWTASGTSAPFQWVEPFSATDLTMIDQTRGETTGSPLRAALIGWVSAPGSSLKVNKPTAKRGRVIAEYVSPKYGMCRLEVGIERTFQ